MTTEQSMQVAARHHKSGHPAEAEAVCRQILNQHPNHAGALNLLGIIAAQAGRLQAGADLVRRAVTHQPDLAEAWGNLGCILVNQAKLEEACATYRRVIQLRPGDAAPHYALGILLRQLGRLDEAIEAFSNAGQLKPDFAEAHFKLGMTLRSRGRHEEAMAAYDRAITVKPDFADAHNNKGNVLKSLGRVHEAIGAYTRATQLKPDDAVAHLNLGNALCEMERFIEALPQYDHAVRLKPGWVEAHSRRGLVLGHLGRFDEALEAHRQAIGLALGEAAAHESQGQTLLLNKDASAAAESFRRALDLSPDLASAWNGLGSAKLALGLFNEAADCFRQALRVKPDEVIFHKNLLCTGRAADEAQSATRLTELLGRADLGIQDRISAGFALGKLMDGAGRFDEAWAHYAAANAHYRHWRRSMGEHFDAAGLHAIVTRMVHAFTPQFFEQRRPKGIACELPVFIVGMPRSGTTLVEQIIASHSAVCGAGELPDIPNLAARLFQGDEIVGRSCDPGSIAKASVAHLQRLRSIGGTASRVVDKLPGNVLHLALVSLLFPGARVIFCRRDPRDTCLSCYFQWFANPRLLFTYDLADCARYYLEVERITAHWLKVLPLRMIEVRYEQLVTDAERESRRLIDFLGLPWEPGCLEFFRTDRAVMTASAWQVRQPIYTGSVGRWRHYERYLGPLRQVLSGDASNQLPLNV